MDVVGMMEVEDDVFFADLNRQLSLLISDDENDQGYFQTPLLSYPAVSIQAFSRAAVYQSTQPQFQFDQFSRKTASAATTADHSKGTGVFIPKSSQYRRRSSNKHQSKNSTFNNSSNNIGKSYRHEQLPSQAGFAQVISQKKC